MSNNRERYLPIVVASLGAPAIYFSLWKAFGHRPSVEGLGNLTNGTLNLAGILVGFLATSLALLYALPDRRSIKFLRQAGALADLVTYLFGDIIVWLMTAISALVIICIYKDLTESFFRVLMGFWIILPGCGVAGFMRSMSIFAKFLKLSSADLD